MGAEATFAQEKMVIICCNLKFPGADYEMRSKIEKSICDI